MPAALLAIEGRGACGGIGLGFVWQRRLRPSGRPLLRRWLSGDRRRDSRRAAPRLQEAKARHRAVEVALDAGDVAQEGAQRPHPLGGRQRCGLVRAVEHGAQDARLQPVGADAAPAALGHLAGERQLLRVARRQLGQRLLDQGGEVRRVLVGEEREVARGEAVAGGVAGAARLALGRGGAFGEASVVSRLLGAGQAGHRGLRLLQAYNPMTIVQREKRYQKEGKAGGRRRPLAEWLVPFSRASATDGVGGRRSARGVRDRAGWGRMQRIVVIGGGFAGLWSAIGAARRREELGLGHAELAITLVNRDGFHGIRVRNYEADLGHLRVALPAVLDPVGVCHLCGTVTGIDLDGRTIAVATPQGRQSLDYDRLILAAGSEVAWPAVDGLAEHAFSIDTFDEAARLHRHLAGLGGAPAGGRDTVLVVGAGLTGVEAACEMPARLRAALPPGVRPRVILADHAPHVGSTMGAEAIPVIREALDALGIEQRTGVRVVEVDPARATLDTGERIGAATVVWTAGMRASGLTALFPIERDAQGRLPVDRHLRVEGQPSVFAAGDCARLLVDDTHASVMSCQHARPMGRFAGHNAVADLMGQPMLPLRIDWYVTVLDLGPWGALYTHGWDRRVVAVGPEAKRTKELINRVRIYPPQTGDAQALLDAAAPTIQAPPERYS